MLLRFVIVLALCGAFTASAHGTTYVDQEQNASDTLVNMGRPPKFAFYLQEFVPTEDNFIGVKLFLDRIQAAGQRAVGLCKGTIPTTNWLTNNFCKCGDDGSAELVVCYDIKDSSLSTPAEEVSLLASDYDGLCLVGEERAICTDFVFPLTPGDDYFFYFFGSNGISDRTRIGIQSTDAYTQGNLAGLFSSSGGASNLPPQAVAGDLRFATLALPFIPEQPHPPVIDCDEGPIPAPPAGGGLVFVAHGWKTGGLVPSWHHDMRGAILGSIPANGGNAADWNVFACSWSGGEPGPNAPVGDIYPEYARFEAIVLGYPIGEQIAGLGYSKVHFIGHSAGSWLIQTAIDGMKSAGSPATIHATFLDAYTPWGEGESQGSWRLGRNADFAEHFLDTGITGMRTDGRLQEAHNINLGSQGHSWPREWYALTIGDPEGPDAVNGWGFKKSQEIGSPINHTIYPRGEETLTSYSVQPSLLYEIPLFVVNTLDWAGSAFTTAGDFIIDPSENFGHFIVDHLPPSAASSDFAAASSSSPNPSWATTLVEVDSDFGVLSFNYEFLSGSGGVFSVHFEGEIIFTAYQDQLLAGPLSETITLGTGVNPAGSYSLAFRLDSDGMASTDVKVSNVIFAGEPTALPAVRDVFKALLMVGLMFAGWSALRGRERAIFGY